MPYNNKGEVFMKRIIFEIILGCAVLFLFLANLGLYDTVKESKRVVLQWQEKVGRLEAKNRELEAITSDSPENILALQKQLDACRKEKLDILLNQGNSLEDPFNNSTSLLPLTEDILSLSHEKLRQYRNEYQQKKKTMTSLQFKTWQKEQETEMESLEDKQIQSQGYVREVREKGIITPLSIFLESEPLGQDSAQILLVLDPKKDRQLALSVKKGDFIRFTGIVWSFSYSFGDPVLIVKDVHLQ